MHTRTTRTLRIAALELLYLPQVEQFGATLRPHGSALFGSIDSDVAEGAIYVYSIGKSCVVTSHRLTVKRDLLFYEREVTSLCLCTLSSDSLALCPIAQPRTRSAEGNVAVFGQQTGEAASWLRAGSLQNATSIMLLPSWFDHWEPRERNAARALVDEPGSTCTDELARALDALMNSISPLYGGRLATEGTLAARVSQAARTAIMWYEERTRAEKAAGTYEQAALARAAKRHIAQHLDAPLTLDGLAHDLLTSRTRLCAAFSQEEGESLGAYIRRARMQRAEELLPIHNLSVAEVAAAVGYPRASSFTVAFERETGMPPSTWRDRIRTAN